MHEGWEISVFRKKGDLRRMGKYIQKNKRPIAPIFPHMPSSRQETSGDAFTVEQERSAAEEQNAQSRINEAKKTEAEKKTKIKTAPKSKAESRNNITVNDLRNGFKMSVIIGDPVSKKYRKPQK